MYFKDISPEGCKRAVLTFYAEPLGLSVNTELKVIDLSDLTNFKHISGSNTPVSKKSIADSTLNAIGKSSLYDSCMQKIEYDITEILPENGGEYIFAMLPFYNDDDYMVVASHRNGNFMLRPYIKYYVDEFTQ